MPWRRRTCAGLHHTTAACDALDHISAAHWAAFEAWQASCGGMKGDADAAACDIILTAAYILRDWFGMDLARGVSLLDRAVRDDPSLFVTVLHEPHDTPGADIVEAITTMMVNVLRDGEA